MRNAKGFITNCVAINYKGGSQIYFGFGLAKKSIGKTVLRMLNIKYPAVS